MSGDQGFRRKAVAELTDAKGVYALCDLDGQPIYVGQSVDGIRSRVRRHLTSARSDVIANRQIDVWEVAFVHAWEVEDRDAIANMERRVFAHFDAILPLMNGAALADGADHLPPPDPNQTIQVIPEDERQDRLTPDRRLARQINQYELLVDYILTVKNAPHLKKSLDAHFSRLVRYHQMFLT
ncbi:GIY-YIG catalytic domain-containing protein [Jannaschia faecimaris]|uniref:GIY-YIG catalytic domain-containing protein n=1 Tax=Jannaschia faecimaris TaxID=1244108 RepID=A0A1H3SL74_9RHOB|nr:GIY-YIG nuclease family protein [Jannaschia faecimaris]SDZ38756.1 GIY-YIG catalytic domain-containing protein [Jannaschia faecimaris]